jgi:hypothetical protein
VAQLEARRAGDLRLRPSPGENFSLKLTLIEGFILAMIIEQ